MKKWNEELRLADGSKTKCLTKIGKKGIPMAIVGVNENKDNIDLMPMGWLNERGCEIEWAEQVSITTPIPHQRRLILGCWHFLPYLDANQIEILLNDLPEAEDPRKIWDYRHHESSSFTCNSWSARMCDYVNAFKHSGSAADPTKHPS